MRYTIIITKELQDTCNHLAKQNFDKQGGEHTFTAGLSSNGSLPITHYWASFIPSNEVGEAIEAIAEGLGEGVTIYKNKTAQEVLQDVGLMPINVE